MGVGTRLAMTFHGIARVLHDVGVVSKGQRVGYSLLQTSHRLEKGLCVSAPKIGWGFDKASLIVDMLSIERKKQFPDETACRIAESVLGSYIRAKEESEERSDKERLAKLKDKITEKDVVIESNRYGGATLLRRQDMLQDESVERLFLTRHSVRDFDDSPVDKSKLEHAVALALRAPSACNRQPVQIYVISGKDRIKAGSDNACQADKYLIVTGVVSAYSVSELNDWIVSASVFCGYLSLSLHAVGIGSCCFRKNIIEKSAYNEAVRKMCHIPEDEQIILEMAIGNYKDEFFAPVSYRRTAQEIVHYLQ